MTSRAPTGWNAPGRMSLPRRLLRITRSGCSERQAETELQASRRVGEIGVRDRQSVLRVCLIGDVATVVRPIERVEDLDDPVGSYPGGHLEMPLEPHVHTVD